ncbi:unnamed protein product [Thelazia callipaeda]|uniref:Late endosomal/lysosomal adaptor and MAPK and MTOR activator 1 n=1 Tax=Thelazia callipaeda TaxID=103827 RepID=A0A0N5CNE1_THECL|nr:unnamed protein product [Thelazia callipaeda]
MEKWEPCSCVTKTDENNINSENSISTKDISVMNLTSDSLSKIATDQKLVHLDLKNANENGVISDISRSTQTVDKQINMMVNLNDLNSMKLVENGYINTSKIAYIDEDEVVPDSYEYN